MTCGCLKKQRFIRHYVGLTLDANCSHTIEIRSVEVTCNVTYSGQWKPHINCLPDLPDQVVTIYDSQSGVVVYRKRVNISSNVTSYIITCEAFFNSSDFNDTTDNMSGMSNNIPSSVSLWNSSEISFSREYFSTL